MLQVPAFRHEDEYWVAEPDGLTSRARMAEASGAYRSAVPPLIEDWAPVLAADIAADTEEAAAALGRFDAYARAVLGETSPSLGPMSSILLRTESTSSSQIENLTVGARQLALAELDQSTSDNARTVVANVHAMEAALDLADHLDTAAVLEMHRALLSGQRGWEHHAGQWRDQLVWIGTSSVSPRGASHVAPQAGLVPGAMEDLMRFVRRDDLPVVVQAAVAHAHFENIHPFSDGNGRTGRALVHAMFRAKRLVTCTTAPVSAGLLKDTDGYFAALSAYRDGDARPIVEQFSGAARFAAAAGARLIDDLAAQIEVSRDKMSGLRSQASAWKVLPHLLSHPVLNANYLSAQLGMGAQSAQNALGQLVDAGVLEERTGLRRNRVWQHPGILGVLDHFAQSLIRA
ncbi:Fic family protein [Promicromonospora kroppenstedtii]|uniref:Fic family protein n=1 Tax=Promicromonospora kroppenstedtii TaxID=440482 RepID=UPI00055CC999|nr:Fic family protein [Promicromonospora kroppenstedtii]